MLKLDGKTGSLRLPKQMFEGVEAATIETWVRFDVIGHYSTLFSFGRVWRTMSLSTGDNSKQVRFFIYDSNSELHLIDTQPMLVAGEWIHLAAVTGRGGMKLYADGMLIGTNAYTGSFLSPENGDAHSIGESSWAENHRLSGALDEFRVWKVERTAEEIRRDRFVRMTGQEAGLLALWNFDSGDARDRSPLHHDAVISGGVESIAQPFPTLSSTRRVIRLHGTARDASGIPVAGAAIRLYDDTSLMREVTTAAGGRYEIHTFDPGRPVNFLALVSSSSMSPDRGQWKRGAILESPESRVDFDLVDPVGISGTVACLDGQPQPGVVVELLSAGRVLQRAVTDVKGDYSFPSVLPGRFQVRCITGRPGAVLAGSAGLTTPSRSQSGEFELTEGRSRSDINFRFSPSGNKGSWRLFDSSQGLPFQRTTAALCTPDGCVWFGTSGGGLIRFDGSRYEVSDRSNGFPSNEVVGLSMGPDGVLWVASAEAISRWDGGRFDHYPVKNPPISIHVTRHGRVLWTDPSGLLELGPAGPRRVAGVPPKAFFSIASDADGTVWLGAQGAVASLKGLDYREILSADFGSPKKVTSIAVTRRGAVWFLTPGDVIRMEAGGFRRFGLAEGLTERNFGGILVDRLDTVWICGADGLNTFGETGFVHHPWPDQIRRPGMLQLGLVTVRAGTSEPVPRMEMSEDRSGALWIPTSVGVFRHDPVSIQSYSAMDGVSGANLTTCALRPDGVMALGSDDLLLSLVRVDQLLQPAKGDPGTQVLEGGGFRPTATLFDRSGDLWEAANWAGIRVFDGKTFRLKRSFEYGRGSMGPNPVCLWEDRAGNIWVGSEFGVTLMEMLPTMSIRRPHPKLSGFAVSMISGDRRGRIWVGTDSVGLLCLENGAVRSVSTNRFRPGNRITAITEDPAGAVWVGSNEGLFRVTQVDGADVVEKFGRASGLPNEQIQCLRSDGRSGVWVGTVAGVCRFDGTVGTVLDARDGLAGNDVRSLEVDSSGALWILCYDGLTRYLPTRGTPGIEIEQLELEGQKASSNNVRTVATDSRVVVRFRGIDLKTLASKQRYRYRLSGPETDPAAVPWSSPVQDRQFEFTPRGPGRHVFEVQSIDRDMNLSPSARLELEAVIPWQRAPETMVAIGSVFLGLAGASGTYGFKYYRQRRRSVTLQAELLEKERSANRAKSLFLANMSHDIRTPLNAILGYSQILERTPGLPAAMRSQIETIHQSGEGLLSLINSILDISKIEAGRIELQESGFELGALVAGLSATFSLSCEQKKLEWRTAIEDAEHPWPGPAGRWSVSGDETKLRRILVNLIGNAVKFTDQGSVSLRVVCPVPAPNHDGASPLRFVFEVLDTGPGIDASVASTLFDPFSRSRHAKQKEGHGLGLAISRRLAEALAGELTWSRPAAGGTCFRLEIPLVRVSAPALPADFPADPVRGGRALSRPVRVLVVDDLATNRQVLQQLLEPLGAMVSVASDGAEALAAVEAQRPEMILMDIWMPGMDGLEVAAALRVRWKDDCPKLVAHSASMLSHERERYLASGFDDVLAKPATLEQFQGCLVRNLGVQVRDGAGSASAGAAPDDAGFLLPAELVQRMSEAARDYNSTGLMRCIDELERLGAKEEQFAQRLRHLCRQSDMETIGSIVGRLPR